MKIIFKDMHQMEDEEVELGENEIAEKWASD